MSPFAILAVALAIGAIVWAILTFSRLRHSQNWLATVTPLASIIGSGFLICGPLLAREFGALAAPAMIVLLLFAYAVGAVVRLNIATVEPFLADAHPHDHIVWLARIGQAILGVAYAISVAYYLKLLAMFALHAAGSADERLADFGVTAILVALGILAFAGGLHRIARLTEATVSAKLGLIAAMLAALALAWIVQPVPPDPLPPVTLRPGGVLMLLGLLITVQGFETSRYMGESFDAPTRIRTMRWSQWISSGIYIAFLILLTPRLGQAARTEGVAGVLDVMEGVAPALGAVVLAAAAFSQLSAAIADATGSTGIAIELSRKRLNTGTGFLVAAGLAIAVTWLTDALEIVSVASRAFALYYAVQCAVTLLVARRKGGTGPARMIGIAVIGLLCLLAAVAGAPAEG